MTTNLGARTVRAQPRTRGERPARLLFSEYAKKYEEYFEMERADGIIQVAHRNGDGWTPVWSQAWRDIGNDPENKVAIITNAGPSWLDVPAAFEGEPHPDESSNPGDQMVGVYRDTLSALEHLLFSMSMPTIGVVNGACAPGMHLEMALLCDITLCSDDAIFREMHPDIGAAPGDGQFLVFQKLMGVKRAVFYALTGEGIDAEAALRFGLVSEVRPRAETLPRAWDIARRLAAMSEAGRYMTTQIVRRALLKSYVDDAGFHLAHEMFGMAADRLGGVEFNPESWEASYRRAHSMAQRPTGTGR